MAILGCLSLGGIQGIKRELLTADKRALTLSLTGYGTKFQDIRGYKRMCQLLSDMVALVDIIVFDLLMMCVFAPHNAQDLPELPSPSVNDTMTATQDTSVHQVSKYIYVIRNPPVGGGLFRSNLWDRGRDKSPMKRTLVIRPLSKNPPSISFEGPPGYEVIVSIKVIKIDEV